MSLGHDLRVGIPAKLFPAFSKEIAKFNKLVDKANKTVKRKDHFQKVRRYPISEDLKNDRVLVKVEIYDRAKTLWPELSEMISKFCHKNGVKFNEATGMNFQIRGGKNPGVFIPCESKEKAERVLSALVVIAKTIREF